MLGKVSHDKNQTLPQLSDCEWLWKLAFSMDIMSYLNDFVLNLQGETSLISDTYSVY